MLETSKPTRPAFAADSRLLSAVELFVGAFIVIGHNVFRILPNEVPILVVIGLVSIRLRNGGLSAVGIRRPSSWPRIVLIAAAAAAARITLGEFVILPLTGRIWPAPVETSAANEITGSPINALVLLAIVWTFAAFGEEFGYRGYLLRRAAELGRGTTLATLAGIVVTAALFGCGHAYKGVSGVIDSGVAGLILGFAFLAARRNLWASILGHGFIDTFAVGAMFFGWAD